MSKSQNNTTIAELKEKCKELGCSTSGSKTELIQRLREIDPSEAWAQKNVTNTAPRVVCEEVRLPDAEDVGRFLNDNCEEEVRRNDKHLLEEELKLVRREIAKSLDNAFNIVLLDELLGNSIVLAISIYYVLISYDSAEIATSCTYIFFALTALTMLYGFCVIGDQLTQKSRDVLDAYYECNWQDMSCRTKKSLLICMIRAKTYLYLTGGKFYIFSLIGFTDVLKTSMAYLSMLRTIM
ncbi:hypothetical protein M0804_013679 [Polistes exclamans]|nr:hypothetical protein M0804_013679 [Polistes exclamans]